MSSQSIASRKPGAARKIVRIIPLAAGILFSTAAHAGISSENQTLGKWTTTEHGTTAAYYVCSLPGSCSAFQGQDGWVRMSFENEAAGAMRGSAAVGGPLKVESQLQVSRSNADGLSMVGRVGFSDTLNFTGDVVPETARFTFDLEGYWGSTSGSSQGTLFVINAANASQLRHDATTQGQATVTVDVPVVAGPNQLLFRLQATSLIDRPAPSATNWSGSAYADFYNSASIVGLNFLDAAARDISTLVAAEWASGTTYPVLQAPAPGSWALMGVGLCVLGVLRRRITAG